MQCKAQDPLQALQLGLLIVWFCLPQDAQWMQSCLHAGLSQLAEEAAVLGALCLLVLQNTRVSP